jgi:PilZ domain
MSTRKSGVFMVNELVGGVDLPGGPRERRADPRVVVAPPRGLCRAYAPRVTAVHSGVVQHHRLLDVSRSGALLERYDERPPPSLHRLEIDVGAAEPVRVLARTVWVGPRHHAVRFVAQDDLDRLELAEAVDHLLAVYAA